MQIGPGRDRGNEITARYAAKPLRYRKGDRHGRDPDMATGADIVIVEHVAKAAIDKGCPWRRRLEAKAEHGAFRMAAHGLDVLGDDAGLRREAAGADDHAYRI